MVCPPYYYVDEAQTIFDNLLATIFNDEWNLFGERRELIIGHSNKRQLLIMFFTEQMQGVIRIISSRLVQRLFYIDDLAINDIYKYQYITNTSL